MLFNQLRTMISNQSHKGFSATMDKSSSSKAFTKMAHTLCPERDMNLGQCTMAVFEDCQASILTTQPPRFDLELKVCDTASLLLRHPCCPSSSDPKCILIQNENLLLQCNDIGQVQTVAYAQKSLILNKTRKNRIE